MKEKKVFVIVCSYSVSPDLIIRKFIKLNNKYNFIIIGVIITNNNLFHFQNKYDNWIVKNGSNSILDFSAYFEGLNLIKDKINESSPILFFNDTLIFKHDFSFSINEIFKYYDLMNEINFAAMAGFKSNYNSICLKNPWSNNSVFIPTYLFLLNVQGFKILNQIKESINFENLIIDENIFDSINANPQFIELLKSHTIYNQSPLSWNKNNYKIQDLNLFYKKAFCVYLEHRLSGEISNVGGLIFLNGSRRIQLNLIFREFLINIFNKILKWIR